MVLRVPRYLRGQPARSCWPSECPGLSCLVPTSCGAFERRTHFLTQFPSGWSLSLGETRVDLVHLLEDLRDAYPGSLEETILTEVVANALDSGAGTLLLETDTGSRTLSASDDGRGMTRRELSRYHDLAATTKRRGHGIGFAGVGIKLGLLACDEVITETRRGRQHAATSWRLAHRTRAPWSWIEPPHLLENDGTAVLLRLSNPLSQLLDPGFLEATVLRHFQPLFEPEFLDVLAPVYPAGFTIFINSHIVVGRIAAGDRVSIGIRIGRQRRPSAVGYLARHDSPLPEAERGLAISTLGKVIRRGWDWLGITPAEPHHVEGVIEVPALAEALTLNKGDFLRHGARGAVFLAYRKAIQEAVAAQFAAWGAAPRPAKRAPRTRPMERDIRRVLGDLAEDYPLLTTLVERQTGGQRRLPLGAALERDASGEWAGVETLSATTTTAAGATNVGQGNGVPDRHDAAAGVGTERSAEHETAAPSQPDRARAATDAQPTAPEMEPPVRAAASASQAAAPVRLPGRARRKHPTTLSLHIDFESLPDDDTLGRLIESTVYVNNAHPAYRRAVASRAEGYHIALAVAAALAPLTVEPARTQAFINAFLARWGEAAGLNGKPRAS